ncbi:MAG: Ig-like domain repeat protein, partial [Euryarchaeota archaeon]
PAVGQSVTFTATLMSGTTGLSKAVKIWHTLNGVRYEDGTHTTATNGVYKFSQAFSTNGTRVYHATFAGDSQYKSSSGTVTVNVAKSNSTLSPKSAVTDNATVGQQFSLNGYLTDRNGNKLAGKKIGIYWLTSDTPLVAWKTVYTDSSGYYQCDVFSDKLATEQYQAKFAGDSQYLPADSKIWTVTWKFQPQLSLQASSSSLSVGQTVTFTGDLKNQTGFRPGEPLRNRIVTLYWRNDPNSDWNTGPTTTTDQNGYYSFSTSSDVAQTVYYYVSYDAAQQTPPTPPALPDSNIYWNVDTSEVTVTWA